MNGPDLGSRGILELLIDYTRRGSQVELILRDGKKISGFRVHEVIAPRGQRMVPQRSAARARGIVWPYLGMPHDDYVQVRDIASVRDELLARVRRASRVSSGTHSP